MTIQQADILICDHPTVDLSGLSIYSDDWWNGPTIPLEEFRPPESTLKYSMMSNLWRGYVATFRLNNDGSFELVTLESPFHDPVYVQNFNRIYTGDFQVYLSRFFGGDLKLKIPFHDGIIDENRANWEVIGTAAPFDTEWLKIANRLGLNS